jgi:hypothetical protein
MVVHNCLMGDEYVRFASGHAANLGAEAVSAIAGGLTACDANSTQAELKFDGVSYNPLPRTLAVSNIPARADGNDMMLILDRIGGDLSTSAATLNSIFGVLYNDMEVGVSFTFSPRSCQFLSSLSNNFPRTTPRFEAHIPAGHTGWMRLYSQDDQAIIGAAINFTADAATSASAFQQGRNLHKMTLTTTSLKIPVIPPSCR